VVRRLLPLVAAALLVGGCGSAPPEVVFTAGGASATAAPAQFCADDDLARCAGDPAAPVSLPVPPGTAVEVAVPDEVAGAPWQIVYSYRDAAGAVVDERTAVFPPDARRSYTLQLPDPGARLLQAQVQRYGPPPQIDPATGEVQFPTGASWVLTTTS
jgi:hypothetical protein